MLGRQDSKIKEILSHGRKSHRWQRPAGAVRPTAQEMAEILTHAAFYAGWPKAWAAFRMAKEVYEG